MNEKSCQAPLMRFSEMFQHFFKHFFRECGMLNASKRTEGDERVARYTIEDIEILRKKSGITYEEAVNLLEYHDGSLARALVDLERNGRLKGEGKNAPADNGFHGVVDFLLRLHLKITKGDTCIVYLNALVMIVAALAAPYVVLAGVILSWVLGYKVRLTRSASADSVEEMLKTVRKNVRQTVSRFTQETEKQTESAETGKKDAALKEKTPRNRPPASGTTPVNVQFPDGATVDVREDQDGYHEAEIR